MASYDLKAILGEKLKCLTDKILKALVDCMCTVGASLCSLDKRVSALESVELPEGGYKPMQEPVASPSASGTAIQFIDSMSQDATGRMTATKKTVQDGTTSQKGVVQLAGSIGATVASENNKAATEKAVRDAIDALDAEVDGLLDDKLDTDGDGSSLTETFSVASSRANIASGESNATIFGKIAKWLGDLKALAFKDKVGTGDVESGTYGISVSGNAGTASAAQSGSALENAINGKSPTSHTHKVKINGKSKTIDATGGTAVDLGTYLTAHQDISGKVDKTTVTSLDDWNTLDDTGLYIVNTSNTVANEPERGKVACYVTNIDGYISQLAVGDRVYMRFKRFLEQSWQPWVVLQDSSGLTVNELYTTSAGGYIDIHGATIEAGGPAGTTEISGGGITTPKVNGIALGPLTDTAAAIPASANDKLNDVTHLLVNGNKTLKLSEMIENKSYVFHVVSSGAVVSVYNDSSSAYTIRHRGSDISLALNSSASLNSSTEPAGEIWLARVGTNIYMSKSCETGTVQDSLKWNGYSLSLGGTPTAGSGTIYFT